MIPAFIVEKIFTYAKYIFDTNIFVYLKHNYGRGIDLNQLLKPINQSSLFTNY